MLEERCEEHEGGLEGVVDEAEDDGSFDSFGLVAAAKGFRIRDPSGWAGEDMVDW